MRAVKSADSIVSVVASDAAAAVARFETGETVGVVANGHAASLVPAELVVSGAGSAGGGIFAGAAVGNGAGGTDAVVAGVDGEASPALLAARDSADGVAGAAVGDGAAGADAAEGVAGQHCARAVGAVGAGLAGAGHAVAPEGRPAGRAGRAVEVVRTDGSAVGGRKGGAADAGSSPVDLGVESACSRRGVGLAGAILHEEGRAEGSRALVVVRFVALPMGRPQQA